MSNGSGDAGTRTYPVERVGQASTRAFDASRHPYPVSGTGYDRGRVGAVPVSTFYHFIHQPRWLITIVTTGHE